MNETSGPEMARCTDQTQAGTCTLSVSDGGEPSLLGIYNACVVEKGHQNISVLVQKFVVQVKQELCAPILGLLNYESTQLMSKLTHLAIDALIDVWWIYCLELFVNSVRVNPCTVNCKWYAPANCGPIHTIHTIIHLSTCLTMYNMHLLV